MGFRDLVLFYVVTGISLRWIATAAGHGQTREEDGYTVGAPELIVEVASSTEAIDLHRKRDDYEQAGVREYVVVALRQERVVWWVNRAGSFADLQPGPDGVYRFSKKSGEPL